MSREVLFTSLLVCLLAAGAGAGETAARLSLVARDPQGAPVPGTRIALDSRDGRLQLRGTTGAEGRYAFENLAAGEYLVTAEAAGFGGAPPARVRLARGEQRAFILDLSLAGFEERVVVTAAAVPQTAAELSKAVTAVTATEIDERGEASIAEALRRVAGVRVQQLGGPGTLTSVRIRGQRSHDTAVLIDGVRFRDPAGTQGDASAFLSDLLALDVDRVEVLRGSGASLHGSHAIGGVVNVLTEGGGGPTRGGLLAEGGSLGFFRGRGHAAGGSDALAWSAGVVRLSTSDGLDGDEPASNTSGVARLQWSPSSDASLTARVWLADAEVGLTESPQAIGDLPSAGIVDAIALSPQERRRYEAGTPLEDLVLGDASFIPNAADPDSSRTSRFLSSLVRFEQRPTSQLGWSVIYHGLWTDRAFFEGPLGVSAFEPAGASRSDFQGRLHTLQARTDLALGDHLLSAGWELEQESFENRTSSSDPALDSLAAVTQRSHAGFAQLQLSLLGGDLALAASGRGQFFRLEAPRLEPRESSPYRDLAALDDSEAAYTGDLSAVVRLGSERTRLRAHVGNGYRAPSLFERFGTSFSSFGYSVFGDPRLRPERSFGIDAGIDHAVATGWRVSATAFQTERREVIVFDFSGGIDPATDPFGRFGGYASTDGGGARGLELELSARPAPGLSLEAAWTWVDADPPGTGAPDADRAYAVPRHQATLVATQQIGDAYLNLDVLLGGRVLAPLFDPSTFTSRTFRLAPMRRVDLGGGWRLRVGDGQRLRLFARIDNLLDRQLFENGFRTPGRTALAGAALEF